MPTSQRNFALFFKFSKLPRRITPMAVSERINGLGLNGLRGNYQHPEYDGLCFRPPQFEVPENINGLGWFPRCSPLANFENINQLPPQPLRLLPVVRNFLRFPIQCHAAIVGQHFKNADPYVAHIHIIKLDTITAHHLSNNTRIIFGCHAVRLRGLFVSLLADSTSTAD
ncbi:putative protein encoded by prophage [Escherichia coli UM146]|nr:putative protein encoded by prophage [Escherichia coli UM146]